MIAALTVCLSMFAAADGPVTDAKSDNKGKVEGTKWSSLPGTVKGQKLAAGTLKLDFGKDGKVVYETPIGTFTGTYELRAGDKLLLKLDKELAGKKEHEQKVVVDKDGKMTVSDSDGTSLDFEKVKAADKKDPDKKEEESANKGKIEGTKWSSLAGTVKGNEIPAGTLKVEFTKDGKITYNTPIGDFTGTYTLQAGDKVRWEFTKELANNKTHIQKIVIKGDKMTISDTDGTSLEFEKVKK